MSFKNVNRLFTCVTVNVTIMLNNVGKTRHCSKSWNNQLTWSYIEDRGAYCFCPVCHSVFLSETLTLLKTFEEWMWELLYFTWVFLVINLSVGTTIFFKCDLDIEFDLFFENFILANNLWTVSARLFVLNLLTLTFDLFFLNWHWS